MVVDSIIYTTKKKLYFDTLIINKMLVKVNAKTLIHYQSSSSMAKRLKQNTFNTLNFSQKRFKSLQELIDACKSQDYDLNSQSIMKLYSLTVKTEYFQHAKLFVERVRIP